MQKGAILAIVSLLVVFVIASIVVAVMVLGKKPENESNGQKLETPVPFVGASSQNQNDTDKPSVVAKDDDDVFAF